MNKNRPDSYTYGYTSAEYIKFRAYGLRYIIFFSILYCGMYCTRLNLSNAAALMIQELGITTSDIGILTGILFWCYGLGMLISGRLSDLFNSYFFIVFSVIGTVVVNLCFGLISGMPAKMDLSGLNGIFQSMSWPSGAKCIPEWWPRNRRGFAGGFTTAFSGFGQAFATIVTALALTVFPSMGFRAAFIIPSVFPVLFLVMFLSFTKPSPEKIGLAKYVDEDEKLVEQEEELSRSSQNRGKLYPFVYLFSNKSFIVIQILAFFTYIVRYGLSTWIPLFFIERFNVDISTGLFASLALPVGMGIGCFLMPIITDRLNNRLSVIPLCCIISGLGVTGLWFLDPGSIVQLVLIEILLFIIGFFIYAIAGIGSAVLLDIGGRVYSGTANGINGCINYLGAGVQAVIYGTVLTKLGWGYVFASMAVICLLCSLSPLLVGIGKRSHYS